VEAGVEFRDLLGVLAAVAAVAEAGGGFLRADEGDFVARVLQ
jgi:hypothetical protein